MLFSASCNLARSKLIFVNTHIYFSSLRPFLLKIYFLGKHLQNCSYLKTYTCRYTHTHTYTCLFTQSRSKIALSWATVTWVQQVKISGRNIWEKNHSGSNVYSQNVTSQNEEKHNWPFFPQIQFFKALNSNLSCRYCPITGRTIRATVNHPSLVALGVQNIIDIGVRISYANCIRCYFRTFYLRQTACFGEQSPGGSFPCHIIYSKRTTG